MADTLESKILLRQRQMETVREPYERGLWKDIGRFVNPRRKDIAVSSASNEKGRNLGTDAYDGTPLGSLNIWADGMQGLLLSGRWFRSVMDNPLLNKIDAVRHWLQIYDLKMYSAFERGNFYAMIPQWLRDGGSIGTATVFTEDVIGTGRTSHTSIHPREIFISENEFGEVDTWHRKFMLTARKAFKKFGNKVSESIEKNAKEHPEKEHEFIHAVYPNDEIVFGKRTIGNKNFRSIYLETKSGDKGDVGNITRESGFNISPYTTWRFKKNSDEVYGRSPASEALTEIFSLNQFSKTLMKAAHLSVEPARNVPVEMRGRVRMEPRGNNYYSDPKKVISVINPGINYPIGAEERKEIRESMQDKFRVKFFNAFIGRTGEATREEILAIKGEQAGLLIAQVDMLYIEGIRSLFDIVSDIEDQRGAFTEEAGMPPVPDEILESDGRINFLLTGPLAQAQREIRELEPIRKTIGNLSEAAAVLGPEMLDVIKKDELSEIILEAGSYPEIAMNSKDERKAIRDARVAERQRIEQQQLLLEAAKVAPSVSKDIEPNSILSQVAEAVT
ncbi:MAG: portal protein [Candidatus Scalindua sp.]